MLYTRLPTCSETSRCLGSVRSASAWRAGMLTVCSAALMYAPPTTSAQEAWLGQRTVIPGVVPEVDGRVIAPDQATPGPEDPTAPPTDTLNRELAAALAASDLVFHGKIVEVEYLTADTPTSVRHPLTYLTFEIAEVLRGDYPKDRIVLMLSGIGRTPDGGFALSSSYPVLAKGDELVMFLAAGSVNGPTYVHHLFAIDGQLFTDDSRALVVDDAGTIRPGAADPRSAILERPLGKDGVWLVRDPPAPEPQPSAANSPHARVAAVAATSRLTVERLRGAVPALSPPARAGTPQAFARSVAEHKSVDSANQTLPLFYVPRHGLVPRD